MDIWTALVTVAAVLMAVAAVASGVYIGWVYRQRKEDALFLRRLVIRDIRVSSIAFLLLLMAIGRLFNVLPGPPLSTTVSTLLIAGLLYGPVSDAVLWFFERRRASHTMQMHD